MKKKGFTLVELLAVIAILAILLLIALPNIMDMFNNAKQQSFENELKNIYKTAQNEWMNASITSQKETVYVNSYEEECENHLDLTGRKNISYYVKFDKNGNIIVFKATDGTYQYEYDGYGLAVEEIKYPFTVAELDDVQELKIYCDGERKFFNSTLYKYYGTLSDAIEEAENDNTIMFVSDTSDYESVEIPSTLSGLTIDLNGHTNYFNSIRNSGTVEFNNTNSNSARIELSGEIQSSGTITFKGNAEYFAECAVINNSGIAKIYDSYFSSYDCDAINNEGNMLIYSGKVGGINNSNILSISGGLIEGFNSATITNSGELNISGNTSIKGQNGILNESVLTMTGGEVNVAHPYTTYGIRNGDNAISATISNANIMVANSSEGFIPFGIEVNKGTVTFNSGVVRATNSRTSEYNTPAAHGVEINPNGTFIMNGGEIMGASVAVNGYGGIGINNLGVANIKTGKVTGTGRGISSSGSLTLGVNDGSISTTIPEIFGSGMRGFGIDSSGVFNFYDGLIKAAPGEDNLMVNGGINTLISPNNIPSGYHIEKDTVDDASRAYLVHD